MSWGIDRRLLGGCLRWVGYIVWLIDRDESIRCCPDLELKNACWDRPRPACPVTGPALLSLALLGLPPASPDGAEGRDKTLITT